MKIKSDMCNVDQMSTGLKKNPMEKLETKQNFSKEIYSEWITTSYKAKPADVLSQKTPDFAMMNTFTSSEWEALWPIH